MTLSGSLGSLRIFGLSTLYATFLKLNVMHTKYICSEIGHSDQRVKMAEVEKWVIL